MVRIVKDKDGTEIAASNVNGYECAIHADTRSLSPRYGTSLIECIEIVATAPSAPDGARSIVVAQNYLGARSRTRMKESAEELRNAFKDANLKVVPIIVKQDAAGAATEKVNYDLNLLRPAVYEGSLNKLQ